MTIRQLRDLLGLLCLIAGVGGLVTVAFLASPLAGWAAASVLVIGAGIYLSIDRQEP